MTNIGFIAGCSILVFGIWIGAFYVDRGLWIIKLAAAMWFNPEAIALCLPREELCRRGTS